MIYFLDNKNVGPDFEALGFKNLSKQTLNPPKGFTEIDHLTNNVYKGTMEEWALFYKNIFEFTDVRYFDIKGKQTGLTSHALRSPDGSFCIPINEADENKSQINEYLVKPIVRNPGTVTAGNASGVNDGAAAMILALEAAVKKHGLTPRARILGLASAAVPPRIMGIGPVPATRKLMERLGL